MKETTTQIQIPDLQKKPSEGTPGVSRAKVRFECTQCGHTEQEFAKPAPAFGE